jgi:hypothetical protein
MNTIQITNPADWREGDHAEWHYPDSDAVVAGTLRLDRHRRTWLGPLVIRWEDGRVRKGPITVTRAEPPPLPEPQALGSVVEVNNVLWVRAGVQRTSGAMCWYADGFGWRTWDTLTRRDPIIKIVR